MSCVAVNEEGVCMGYAFCQMQEQPFSTNMVPFKSLFIDDLCVDQQARGQHIGEQLVSDCLVQARNNGFKLMQFNAVVENNTHARHLYERLGFVQVGMIPNGFLITRGVIPLPLGMGI